MEAALQGAVAEEEEASAAPEPSMDASWELLRLAIKERDFKLVTTTLCRELIDIYQTPEFGREYCKPLDDSWGYNTDRQAMLDAIRGVTNQVMLPVITGYGFTADRKGSNEAEATILALSKEYKEVAVKGTEMQRIILNQFPRMKRS
eukprot:gnl/TRDRNA2_/TRDRNA2_80094_c0_seq2.p1 gnl/TRDRNA2_/TRDRNA2_80094_c0~~gnl/TRDRNA2_/TRDRNA2_80094_c0_seq2.p1  ORF type:complete len:147 (+),score=40.87 gnl/TRDRNA2_/TRDRNA2_80094_c0_seq2:103-543(+)